MKKITVLIFLSVLVLVLPITSSAHKYDNDRAETSVLTRPMKKIGRLQFYKYIKKTGTVESFSCTAFLVSKNLIMTNGHCVTRDKKPSEVRKVIEDGEKWPEIQNDAHNFSFELGLNGVDNYLAKSGIEKIVHYEQHDHKLYRSTDFAILKLKKNLGLSYGWFKTKSIDDTDNFAYKHWNKLKISGYSPLFTDFRWTLTTNSSYCEFKSYMSDRYGLTFYNDCDMGMGDSGSPIYICPKGRNECYVLGIAAAEKFLKSEGSFLTLDKYDKRHAHIAIDTEVFRELIKYYSSIY